MSLNVTGASRADLRRPAALWKAFVASRDVNVIFFCWHKPEVFHFAAVSKSILRMKAGVLMALRNEPLINEGTGRRRMICSDPARPHVRAPRVTVVFSSQSNVTLLLAFRGETFRSFCTSSLVFPCSAVMMSSRNPFLSPSLPLPSLRRAVNHDRSLVSPLATYRILTLWGADAT